MVIHVPETNAHKTVELARKACELLAKQTEFLQKEWHNLSAQQVSEYNLRNSQIRDLILAINGDRDGVEGLTI